ncbi:DUF2809 domain-containing protein [Microbacterium sp. Se5.02b]|uniref:DUF2809 domain-containing protein n=1 Tax=Microbacterium sp. Se5.02b TaxID=2864103 RepID=UPI001C68A0EC|nr:DUF2809 domain-containing protein [Microbacterium sp. Se5.02b]QYM63218.1 DUF2809 domain-containing protein [Microbacterium sp. Se5.02b]
MRADAVTPIARRRIVLLVLAAVTVAAGLIVHRTVTGVPGDIAGDALYAVLISLLVALVAPRAHPAAVAVIAFAVCAAVELLQLTGLPASWRRSSLRPRSSSAPASMRATSSCTPWPSRRRLSPTAPSAGRWPARSRETPQGALPKESALCEEVLTQPTSVR